MLSIHKVRIDNAKTYLSELRDTLRCDWLESFEKATTVHRKLALLHPGHLVHMGLSTSTINSISGKRNFPPRRVERKCNSMLIWGYECDSKEDLQQDHLFPYSLGGATDSRNRIFLCRLHNQIKGSDIHFYPWEDVSGYTEYWLDSKLKKIREFYCVSQ